MGFWQFLVNNSTDCVSLYLRWKPGIFGGPLWPSYTQTRNHLNHSWQTQQPDPPHGKRAGGGVGSENIHQIIRSSKEICYATQSCTTHAGNVIKRDKLLLVLEKTPWLSLYSKVVAAQHQGYRYELYSQFQYLELFSFNCLVLFYIYFIGISSTWAGNPGTG